MIFGALGDIHGDFAAAASIMTELREVPFWLCVGDVADDEGQYQPLPAPLHWIKGNNENFDAIAAGDLPENLHFVPNARPVTLGGGATTIAVVGLGGTLAPTWYETPANSLPDGRKPGRRAKTRDDKRRHFVREEVEACRAFQGVDVFMTHEAPRPYRAPGVRMDMGKTPINEALAAMKPRLHLFGHHHRFSEGERQGVRSVGLDLVSRSFLLVDASTLAYQLVTR